MRGREWKLTTDDVAFPSLAKHSKLFIFMPLIYPLSNTIFLRWRTFMCCFWPLLHPVKTVATSRISLYNGSACPLQNDDVKWPNFAVRENVNHKGEFKVYFWSHSKWKLEEYLPLKLKAVAVLNERLALTPLDNWF